MKSSGKRGNHGEKTIRQIAAFLAAAAMLCSSGAFMPETLMPEIVTAYAAETGAPVVPIPLAGDVNSDGSVDIADVVALQKFLLMQTVLNEEQGAQADLDGNRKLSAADLTLLKRLLQ